MRIEKYFLSICCGLLPIVGFAEVPFTFQPGTPARAAEVNANFGNLDSRLNGSFGTLIVSRIMEEDDSVAGALCPADRLVVSASCFCDNVDGARNFGVLFGCSVVGNGALAGCFPEPVTFDPSLPLPLATVTAVCLSGRTNDGTPLEPVPVELSGLRGSSKTFASSTDIHSGTENVMTLESVTAFEAALKSLQDQAMDYSIRLQSR
jgi:hypothetical protein